MMLEPGDLVLVSNRRLFDGDAARFFIGRTMTCEGPLFKAEGYSFMRDLSNGHVIKKEEKRTRAKQRKGNLRGRQPNLALSFLDPPSTLANGVSLRPPTL